MRRRLMYLSYFFFSSRRRHTRSLCDWSSDVCSSDLSFSRYSPGADAIVYNQASAPGLYLEKLFDLLGIGEQLKPKTVRYASSAQVFRSEERRVGKEGRSRWSPYH